MLVFRSEVVPLVGSANGVVRSEVTPVSEDFIVLSDDDINALGCVSLTALRGLDKVGVCSLASNELLTEEDNAEVAVTEPASECLEAVSSDPAVCDDNEEE